MDDEFVTTLFTSLVAIPARLLIITMTVFIHHSGTVHTSWGPKYYPLHYRVDRISETRDHLEQTDFLKACSSTDAAARMPLDMTSKPAFMLFIDGDAFQKE